jgi:hypothetical protein
MAVAPPPYGLRVSLRWSREKRSVASPACHGRARARARRLTPVPRRPRAGELHARRAAFGRRASFGHQSERKCTQLPPTEPALASETASYPNTNKPLVVQAVAGSSPVAHPSVPSLTSQAFGAHVVLISTALGDLGSQLHASYVGGAGAESQIAELFIGPRRDARSSVRTGPAVEFPVVYARSRCLYDHLLSLQASSTKTSWTRCYAPRRCD